MNILFNQNDFSAGIDREFDPTKLPYSAFMFLSNGRNRRDAITPVKTHSRIHIPAGINQGIYAVGNFIITFVAGIPYFWDVSIVPPAFQVVPNWNPALLSTTANFIYCELVPYSSNQFNFQDQPSGGNVFFNGAMAQTPECILCCDGINQPVIIFANWSYQVAGTFNSWTQDIPNYVPIGIMPRLCGQKLYIVSPDKKRIFQSVSGRPLDFMVNVTSAGDAGGDATTVAKAVDYNDITGLFPMSDGSLLVTTIYSSYLITLNLGNLIFGEPFLQSQSLFPVGALNPWCFVDLLGDSAFITQMGIQSFNYTQQVHVESNNFPLGAKIQNALIQPQTTGVAVEFQDYALFAVKTIYGDCVIVYDRIRKCFAGFDFGFGAVKKFAVIKSSGVQRLFFVNYSNELYEAYAGNGYAVTRFYGGDFVRGMAQTTYETPKEWAGVIHKCKTAHASFVDVQGTVQGQISYFADHVKIETAAFTLTGDEDAATEPPIPLPYNPVKSTQTVDLGFKEYPISLKSGVLIEWQGQATLTGIMLTGEPVPSIGTYRQQSKVEGGSKVIILGDVSIGTSVGTVGNVSVTIGSWYTIAGSVNVGDKILTNTTFQAAVAQVAVISGTLYTVDNTLISTLRAENPDAFAGLGNIVAADTLQATCAYKYIQDKLFSIAGNTEWDQSPVNFFSWIGCPEFFQRTVGPITFFGINAGYNTAGCIFTSPGVPTGPCLDALYGNAVGSQQYLFFKSLIAASTSPFKVALIHEPPWSAGIWYPGFTPLQWDFADLGINLVISGHDRNYQRMDVNGLQFVVSGWNNQTADALSGHSPYPLLISSTDQGYLKLEADSFNLKGTAYSITQGKPIDIFNIAA